MSLLILYKIIDGSALVHLLTPSVKATTFREYSEKIFVEKLTNLVFREDLQWVDIVYDQYFKCGIKANTRSKRGNGIEAVVRKGTPMFSNWRKFLLIDKNKEDIGNINSDNLFGLTSQDKFISNLSININDLPLCIQEEADTRLFLNVKNAALMAEALE